MICLVDDTMHCTKCLTLLIFTFLSGCHSSISNFQGDALKALEDKFWTFNLEGYSCENAVQTITEVDAGVLEFIWHDVKNKKIDNSHQSRIKRIENGYIELMPKVDEGSHIANPFNWTIVLKSNQEFCWRRSDWKPLLCTEAMISCGLRDKK